MHLTFLGTGASGGTPGPGRSHRRESSLLVTGPPGRILVDATRHLGEQLDGADRLDAVVLTHGHRDACGGIPQLRRRRDAPLPVIGHHLTHRAIRRRYRRLDHVELLELEPGRRTTVAGVDIEAVEVPHARSERFATFAWRLARHGRAVVYASDVAALTADLERFAHDADVLVLDGAMYGRSMPTHLRIEDAVPAVCGWAVARILLTQIGRTAPRHEELEAIVGDLCDRAAPAFDGLEVDVGEPA